MTSNRNLCKDTNSDIFQAKSLEELDNLLSQLPDESGNSAANLRRDDSRFEDTIHSDETDANTSFSDFGSFHHYSVDTITDRIVGFVHKDDAKARWTDVRYTVNQLLDQVCLNIENTRGKRHKVVSSKEGVIDVSSIKTEPVSPKRRDICKEWINDDEDSDDDSSIASDCNSEVEEVVEKTSLNSLLDCAPLATVPLWDSDDNSATSAESGDDDDDDDVIPEEVALKIRSIKKESRRSPSPLTVLADKFVDTSRDDADLIEPKNIKQERGVAIKQERRSSDDAVSGAEPQFDPLYYNPETQADVISTGNEVEGVGHNVLDEATQEILAIAHNIKREQQHGDPARKIKQERRSPLRKPHLKKSKTIPVSVDMRLETLPVELVLPSEDLEDYREAFNSTFIYKKGKPKLRKGGTKHATNGEKGADSNQSALNRTEYDVCSTAQVKNTLFQSSLTKHMLGNDITMHDILTSKYKHEVTPLSNGVVLDLFTMIKENKGMTEQDICKYIGGATSSLNDFKLKLKQLLSRRKEAKAKGKTALKTFVKLVFEVPWKVATKDGQADTTVPSARTSPGGKGTKLKVKLGCLASPKSKRQSRPTKKQKESKKSNSTQQTIGTISPRKKPSEANETQVKLEPTEDIKNVLPQRSKEPQFTDGPIWHAEHVKPKVIEDISEEDLKHKTYPSEKPVNNGIVIALYQWVDAADNELRFGDLMRYLSIRKNFVKTFRKRVETLIDTRKEQGLGGVKLRRFNNELFKLPGPRRRPTEEDQDDDDDEGENDQPQRSSSSPPPPPSRAKSPSEVGGKRLPPRTSRQKSHSPPLQDAGKSRSSRRTSPSPSRASRRGSRSPRRGESRRPDTRRSPTRRARPRSRSRSRDSQYRSRDRSRSASRYRSNVAYLEQKTRRLERDLAAHKHSGSVLKVMHDLWQDDLMCDVTIVIPAANSPTTSVMYKAHRLVLASASRYLYRCLVYPGEEIALPSCRKEVFTNVLQYIYTGKASLTGDLVEEISHMAEVLEMQDLLDKCHDYMGTTPPLLPITAPRGAPRERGPGPITEERGTHDPISLPVAAPTFADDVISRQQRNSTPHLENHLATNNVAAAPVALPPVQTLPGFNTIAPNMMPLDKNGSPHLEPLAQPSPAIPTLTPLSSLPNIATLPMVAPPTNLTLATPQGIFNVNPTQMNLSSAEEPLQTSRPPPAMTNSGRPIPRAAKRNVTVIEDSDDSDDDVAIVGESGPPPEKKPNTSNDLPNGAKQTSLPRERTESSSVKTPKKSSAKRPRGNAASRTPPVAAGTVSKDTTSKSRSPVPMSMPQLPPARPVSAPKPLGISSIRQPIRPSGPRPVGPRPIAMSAVRPVAKPTPVARTGKPPSETTNKAMKQEDSDDEPDYQIRLNENYVPSPQDATEQAVVIDID